MKVICDRAALVDAVNTVSGIVASRTPTPVLKCLKLTASKAEPAGLILTATDLEVGLRLGVAEVDVVEEGEAAIPAEKLSQIARACNDATLTIETEEHAVHIRGAGSHFKVFGYDPKEFPPVRDFTDTTVDCEINGRVLQRLITRTLFAAAVEHSRYAINGVLFARSGNQLRLVATDGRRLAMATGETSGGDGDRSCIIPSKALKLAVKLVDDPDASIRMAIEDNQVLFAFGNGDEPGLTAVLSSKLVEGAFPPFEDVVPKEHDKKVSFEASTLGNAVRQAALLTNEESKGVRMSFEREKLTLTSRAPEMGEATVEIKLDDYQGDPVEIGFNPGFIIDALNVIDGGPITFELKEANKPGVLRTGNDFTYVLMPVNLQ